MDPVKEWWVEEQAKRAIVKLEAHEFKALYVRTKEEAVQEIWKHVTPKARIGVGGSVTIRALGILDQLEAQGYTVYDHWKRGKTTTSTIPSQSSSRTTPIASPFFVRVTRSVETMPPIET